MNLRRGRRSAVPFVPIILVHQSVRRKGVRKFLGDFMHTTSSPRHMQAKHKHVQRASSKRTADLHTYRSMPEWKQGVEGHRRLWACTYGTIHRHRHRQRRQKAKPCLVKFCHSVVNVLSESELAQTYRAENVLFGHTMRCFSCFDHLFFLFNNIQSLADHILDLTLSIRESI